MEACSLVSVRLQVITVQIEAQGPEHSMELKTPKPSKDIAKSCSELSTTIIHRSIHSCGQPKIFMC